MNEAMEVERLEGHYPRPDLPDPRIVRIMSWAVRLRAGLLVAAVLATLLAVLRVLLIARDPLAREAMLLALGAIELLVVLWVSVALSVWVYHATENLRTLQSGRLRFSPAVSTFLVAMPLIQLIGWWFVLDQIAVLSEGTGKRLVPWYAVVTGAFDVTLWYYLLGSCVVLVAVWTSGMAAWMSQSAVATHRFGGLANGSMILALMLGVGAAWATDRMVQRIIEDQRRLAAKHAEP